MEESVEQEIPYTHLSSIQRENLSQTVEEKRKNCLNKKFVSGETMVNLMLPGDPTAKIIHTQNGCLETRYCVPEDVTYTIVQTAWGIAPQYNSTNATRVGRLDGKFANKVSSDGSIPLGRFYYNDFVPSNVPGMYTGKIATLQQEMGTDLEQLRKQRLPQPAQNLQHTPKVKVEKKPTSEELASLAQARKTKRLEQFTQFEAKVNQLHSDILTTEEQVQETKGLKLGLQILKNYIDKEEGFNPFLENLKKKYNPLKEQQNQILRSIVQVQNTPTYSLPPQASGEDQQAVREEARRRIEAEVKKEKSHLERPNANPTPLPEEKEEQQEDIKGKDKVKKEAYVFQFPLTHSILEALQNTSTENSSYEGIRISREQLENFVDFLKQAEKLESSHQENTLEDSNLGYCYDSSAGKGSHTKVKLGYGVKPIILSQQGRLLTIDQIRDLKIILIQKGLIKTND